MIEKKAMHANHENDNFSNFWKVKPKSYQSNMKQDNTTELLGYPMFKIYNKNGPANHLRTPECNLSIVQKIF